LSSQSIWLSLSTILASNSPDAGEESVSGVSWKPVSFRRNLLSLSRSANAQGVNARAVTAASKAFFIRVSFPLGLIGTWKGRVFRSTLRGRCPPQRRSYYAREVFPADDISPPGVLARRRHGAGSMHLGGVEASNAVHRTLLSRACCTTWTQSSGKPAGIEPVHFAPCSAAAGPASR